MHADGYESSCFPVKAMIDSVLQNEGKSAC